LDSSNDHAASATTLSFGSSTCKLQLALALRRDVY
jgi:hypothetical protein